MNVRHKAALVACSNPLSSSRKSEIAALSSLLSNLNIQVEVSPLLFEDDLSNLPSFLKRRADILNHYFLDPAMDAIFDVSGGDLSNTLLPYLDYQAIAKSRAVFYGYSDLTCLMNAIVVKTGKSAVNYQIRNLLSSFGEAQISYVRDAILPDKISVQDLQATMIRGDSMEGYVLGGNSRCLLKLAGTPYWPDWKEKILLLESMGGGSQQILTQLTQYQQLGVFDQVNGILLGTFTKMETEDIHPRVEDMILQTTPPSLPIAKTHYIGHGGDARAIRIGAYIDLK